MATPANNELLESSITSRRSITETSIPLKPNVGHGTAIVIQRLLKKIEKNTEEINLLNYHIESQKKTIATYPIKVNELIEKNRILREKIDELIKENTASKTKIDFLNIDTKNLEDRVSALEKKIETMREDRKTLEENMRGPLIAAEIFRRYEAILLEKANSPRKVVYFDDLAPELQRAALGNNENLDPNDFSAVFETIRDRRNTATYLKVDVFAKEEIDLARGYLETINDYIISNDLIRYVFEHALDEIKKYDPKPGSRLPPKPRLR